MVKLEDVKVYLFDMDGTLNMGEVPLDGAMDTLRILAKNGKRVYFVTNNSSKSKIAYIQKLARMGYEATEDQIVTSGMATVSYLHKNYPNKSVYVMGTEVLRQEFIHGGIDVKEVGEDADIVVLAFDIELTYAKLWHTDRKSVV